MQAIPAGFHTATPVLTVRDGASVLDFYKRAFGAQEIMRMPGPDGSLMHAEIKIGDSILMVSDEQPNMGCRAPVSVGGCTSYVYLYVQDVDAVFKKAVEAGAKVIMPPTDMFWGDRFGQVQDPFGHLWQIATHVRDVPPAEMEKRAKEAMASMR